MISLLISFAVLIIGVSVAAALLAIYLVALIRNIKTVHRSLS